MNSIKRGLIAQNDYSTTNRFNDSDCQTKRFKRVCFCAYSLPMEKTSNHARIRAREKTIISHGKYRIFVKQLMSTILYEERKND